MTKGWERASLELNTRPVRAERAISREDLLVPRTADRLLLAGASLACGLGLSLLYVFWPLLLLAPLGVGGGRWILPIVVAAGLVFAVVLYVWERRERRDIAEELAS